MAKERGRGQERGAMGPLWEKEEEEGHGEALAAAGQSKHSACRAWMDIRCGDVTCSAKPDRAEEYERSVEPRIGRATVGLSSTRPDCDTEDAPYSYCTR